MEEKRKEYAKMADEFVQSLENRKKELKAMYTEPNPEPLMEALTKAFNNAATEKEALDKINAFQAEMLQLDITKNPYTTLTVEVLRQRLDSHTTWFANCISELNHEKEMKDQYCTRVGELLDWWSATEPRMRQTFDNTLEGVKSIVSSWNQLKSGELAEKEIEKVAIEADFKKIAKYLADNHRPEYSPADEFTLANLKTTFDNIHDAVKEIDEEIAGELARQEKLARMVQQFDDGVAEFNVFVAAKEEYLKTKDPIATLNDARLKIKAAESFNSEFGKEKKVVAQLDELAKDIVSMNYIKSDEIGQRRDEVIKKLEDLLPLHEQLMEYLNGELKKQQEMDRLRQQFAKLAKDFQVWSKNMVSKLAVRSFGMTLEAVTKYKTQLDENDKEVTAASEKNKSDVEAVAQKMQEMNITDNKYTQLTTADAAKFHEAVMEALKKRQADYEKELERQKMMEAKCQEFAKLADEFVNMLQNRKKELKAKFTEPKPEVLIEELKKEYDNAAPQKADFEKLVQFQSEMAQLKITKNPFTKWTRDTLRSKLDAYCQWFAGIVLELDKEKDMKEQYTTSVNELLDWCDDVAPRMHQAFDNTLEGAKRISADWNQLKSGEITEKDIQKAAVETSLQKIAQYLKDQERPEFVPEDKISMKTLAEAFTKVHDEEKDVDAEIAAEVARQQRMEDAVKQFNEAVAEFEVFLTTKEEYLKADETINNLNDARLAENLMKTNEGEINLAKPRLQSIMEQKTNIVECNFHAAEEVKTKAEDTEKRYNALFDLLKAKHDRLQGTLGDQLKKEELRMQFANAASEFADFIEDAVETVKDYNFGSTLEAMTAYKQELDNNTNTLRDKVNEKKGACDKIMGELKALNVADNRHTTHNEGTINQLNGQFEEAIKERQNAYDEAVKKETEFEAKRKEFAAKAADFVKGIEEKKKSLKGLNGEPAALIEQVKSIYSEGKAEIEAMAALSTLAGEMQAMGILSNSHTQYTVPNLMSYQKQYDTYVKNQLAAFEEDRVRRERDEAAQKEKARRERIENMQVEFQQKARPLEIWLEKADDILTDPINVNSVDEIKKIDNQFRAFCEEIPTQQQTVDQLKQLSEDLKKEAELDSGFQSIEEHWTTTNTAIEERKNKIAETVKQQEAHEGMRLNFAKVAQAFKDFLVAKTKEAENVSGDVEKQLAALRKVTESLGAESSKLKEISALAEEMKKQRIQDNPHTQLTDQTLELEYKGLIENTKKRYEVMEKDMIMKKMGNVTPEQLKEFKDMFAHFDRDNSGFLNESQFKACLSGLGEEMPDSELKAAVAKLAKTKPNAVSFDEFLNFMVSRTADTDSKEQIVQAFKDLSGGKNFITENQMRDGMDSEKVNYLCKVMPKSHENSEAYDYMAWINSTIK